jgi:hypothetical protein
MVMVLYGYDTIKGFLLKIVESGEIPSSEFYLVNKYSHKFDRNMPFQGFLGMIR